MLVVIDGDLDDLYLGEQIKHQYFRLDVDPLYCGKLFREPFPHVHIRGKGEPRYPVDGLCDGNPIIGFLDFIYRNYRFETWLEWARFVWQKNASEYGTDRDYFENVVRAFETNQIGLILENYSDTIERLKKYLAFERIKKSRLVLDKSRIKVMSYIL